MELNNTLQALSNQKKASQEHYNYANIRGLDNLKQQAREDQRTALRPVAEQFEAIFVQQILKEARNVSFDDGWLDGNQGDFYKDWHDKQLSQNIAAKGTLGFADSIVEQLAPSLPAIPKKSQKQNHILETLEDKQVSKKAVSSTEQALALRPIVNKD
jgi:flagellar protein FlgJ